MTIKRVIEKVEKLGFEVVPTFALRGWYDVRYGGKKVAEFHTVYENRELRFSFVEGRNVTDKYRIYYLRDLDWVLSDLLDQINK